MNMYNPCETCYLRFGHSYTGDCDEKCEYAKIAKSFDTLANVSKRMLDELHTIMCNGNMSARSWQKLREELVDLNVIVKE